MRSPPAGRLRSRRGSAGLGEAHGGGGGGWRRLLKPDPPLPRLPPLDKVSIRVYKRRPRRYNCACGGGAPAASSDAPLRSGHALRAVSSGGERFVDTEEVTGSNPVLPI